MKKPPLRFDQLWNMNLGFFGIQFGWGLQMANMSAIYEYLGASPDQIPMLWLAAPLTGMLVQPIIGHLSDHTWGRLGRRRPYFLVGAILSSAALLAMPNASALWMAAGLLWMLDASINISMEPFRAFVADLLPEEQRTEGFAMQSLFIGLGAVIASALPWLLTHAGVSGASVAGHAIPPSVKLSFTLGAVVFLAAVLWTVFTTKEYPPDPGQKLERRAALPEILSAIREMPRVMRQLAWVQVCTWLGLFCMWLYFPVAVARQVFGATDPQSPLYSEGVAWGGLCFGMYSAVCFVFSAALQPMARALSRRRTHGICLVAGALGLLSVAVIHNKYLLLISMVGVGIAWASTLSMPYAMLAGSLPERRIGLYMGIFNFFIVTPEIVASIGFGWVMSHLLNNNRLSAVVCGAFFLLAAALLSQRVDEQAT
ncbi:MAG TPA: MFS transporter [Candidatus Sulfopaludibacter sp.]|jgi:maltose/moltooligosaccharide transporter|nr:MFS transporter [Candidatus Sulfopaludibacter sp.]